MGSTIMKPILFNVEMVRAILDGRKTVTRRIVKPQPNGTLDQRWGGFYEDNEWILLKEPYRPGDILWVRETWKKVCAEERYYENGEVVSSDELFGYKFRADNAIRWDIRSPRDDEFFLSEIIEAAKWRPSIHMPREVARIFLLVKNVRVERLQEIKNHECVAEGAVKRPNYTKRHDLVLHNRYRQEFAELWDSTIKPADREKYGWAANPLVWVIEFEKCEKPEEVNNG